MGMPTLDPTAGERARAMHLEPEAVQRVNDPTDPRFGEWPLPMGEHAADGPRIVDPTDPGCGRRFN